MGSRPFGEKHAGVVDRERGAVREFSGEVVERLSQADDSRQDRNAFPFQPVRIP